MRIKPFAFIPAFAVILMPLAGHAQTTTSSASSNDTPGQRILGTADQGVPKEFVIFENEETGTFIKPVLQMSATVVGYIPDRTRDDDQLSGRTATLLLSRLGVEGQLTDWIHFRSVFERNIGFSLARNGPVGTSVWEGTGSFQARENYLRLQAAGFSITGGIVPDPASIDFIADATLDMFGMDPYVRDPLLVSGFSQGQGFLFRYSRWGLTAGMSFTAGNPLVSSLSFGFGGQVSSLGTLFSAPLRALANGIPGSDIHMVVYSPSLSYAHEWFDIKVAGQFYTVDIDLTNDEDQALSGYNLRSTAQVKIFDLVRVFGTVAVRSNEQVAVPDITTKLEDDFSGLVIAGGAEFNYANFSVGGQVYSIRSEATPDNALTTTYANIGVMYWAWQRNMSLNVRFAYSNVDAENEDVAVLKTFALIGGLRLTI